MHATRVCYIISLRHLSGDLKCCREVEHCMYHEWKFWHGTVMHCLWHPMTSSSQRDGWPAWELVCPVDRFLQGCETEFDRLCLGFTYLEQWTFAQYSQKKGKTVCWNATFMVMIWHGHPVWIRWANFSYPRRSGPDVCTAFVGEVLADEIPPDRSTKSGKWFASRFDGRDLHCPSCSEFQAIHCWT